MIRKTPKKSILTNMEFFSKFSKAFLILLEKLKGETYMAIFSIENQSFCFLLIFFDLSMNAYRFIKLFVLMEWRQLSIDES